jgi:two-component system NtrC family sensor kinase
MEHNSNNKILVIDDEESIRILLHISLTHKGFEVITAEDGGKGIEIFKQERPPIVITDIKMPGIDGLEVLKEIRELNPDTRVIVITGHGDMESAIEALKFEASDFINKPIKDDALMVAIKRAQEVLLMKQKLKEYTENLELMVKEATEELTKAHDFQKNLIQSSIDGIIASRRDGTIIVFNQGSENLLGYSADEVIGEMQMYRIFPRDVAETIKEMFSSQEYGGKNRLVNYENSIISKDGEEIPVRTSGTILFENDEEIGSVCFFQDLREIKRLQKELIENERLSAIGQTVTGMAHYIKNILNGLEGGIYMVNTGLNKDKQDVLSKGWGMVQNNVAKISALVMNMLSYSKEREPELEYCSPNDIAQEVFDLIEERANKSNIKLVRDFDSSISTCYMDPDGLYRCLLNLVTNAIDACSPDSNKKKDCSVIIKTRKEDSVTRFDIVDNGMGMSKGVQEKLFQRFFTTKGSKGSGFGLLVTRKIIQEQGGDIAFKSEPGIGTTFTIYLPDRGSGEAKGA